MNKGLAYAMVGGGLLGYVTPLFFENFLLGLGCAMALAWTWGSVCYKTWGKGEDK